MNADSPIPYKIFGETLAAASHGLPMSSVEFLKGASQAVDTADDSGAMDLRKVACEVAAAAYLIGGNENCPEFLVFTKLAKAEKWDPAYNCWAEPVLEVLGRQQLARQEEKRAAVAEGLGVATLLKRLLGGGAAVVPTVAKIAPMASVAAGTGAGTLWWLANRDAEQDDAKLRQMKIKRDYYRSLSGEINDEINRRGLTTDLNDRSSGGRGKVADALRDTSMM